MRRDNDIGGVFGETLKDGLKQIVEFWSSEDAAKKLSEQPVIATAME